MGLTARAGGSADDGDQSQQMTAGAGSTCPPPSDPTRPPRLSRRERNFYCFHIDLSAEVQHMLPSLVRYVNAYGARYSAFLDISVTHIITDKPFKVVQSSVMVHKFGCKLISLADFLQKIIESYGRQSAQLITRPPLSPTLRKAAEEVHYGKNLSHMLANERRATQAMAPGNRGGRTITPLYNSAAVQAKANPSGGLNGISPTRSGVTSKLLGILGDKKVVFEAFLHPYMMIEELFQNYAPVFKEYSSEEGHNTFPYLNVRSDEYHCPWVGKSPKGLLPAIHNHQEKSPVLVPRPDPHRAMRTVRTLAQHHTATTTAIANRAPLRLRGLGLAPLPPLTAVGATTAANSHSRHADRKKPGFCECCYEKYSQMEKHLALETHRKLVTSTDFYRAVDKVIALLARPIRLPSPSRRHHSDEDDIALTPISPAKSIPAAGTVARVKSIPLKNITNLPPTAPTAVPGAAPLVKPMAALDIEVGSDSPIYSSPSLKRRRSQRLVSRFGGGAPSRSASKFVL